ncbi:MAG: efflux RND transporter periplasmic adaptor subunit [Ignavibacteria bacterium]|nr:efflux RND transporter periplasmic adaptor subunit [Ignavibacteria bacterium]
MKTLPGIRMVGNRKNSFSAIAMLSSILFLFGSCGKEEQKQGGPAAVSYPVIITDTRNVTVNYDYVASIQGQEDVEIRPEVEGSLTEIYIDEGQNVRRGQALFKIDDQIQKEQVISAEADLNSEIANLDKARLDIEKVKPLVEKNIVSRFELDAAYSNLKAAESRVDKARSMLANAKTRLGKTLVSSPSDGTAGKIYFRQGSLVSPSTKDPLTIISKNDQMYAYFAITERDVLEFREYYDGKTMRESIARIPEVRLLLPNGELYPYGGKIDATTGLINSQTGTINLRARFPNPGGVLRSGNSGTVRIPDFTNNAVLIPQKSTYDIQDKTFVFVVNSDSTVDSRPVTVWDISGNFYIIEKGLSPGERIVYEGTGRLRDGMKIIPETVSLDSLIEADKETITVKETN